MIRMSNGFVIQIHTGFGPVHYDLMLDRGESLATWQLSASPVDLAAGGQLPARRLADHRRAYLTYEGPLSGGRGQVAIVDRGTYEPRSIRKDRWRVQLTGSQIAGQFELVRGDKDEDVWAFVRT